LKSSHGLFSEYCSFKDIYYKIIEGDSLARGPKLVYLQIFNEFVNQLTDDELTTGYYQQDGATFHTSNASMQEIESFLKRELSQNILATQISRSNICRLLSLGPIEGQSVQKYTPHNKKIKDAITPRDSTRQRRHFGKSTPEFGETHLSVLGCERKPHSASIMSRSCFPSFPVCVYKFSSHYLNNVIFYRQ